MNPEHSEPIRERPAVDAVAGLMASAAIFIALVALAYRPARIAPAAIAIALIAAGMSRRWSTLSGIAAVVAGVCWMCGMAIAVVTGHPLW